MRHVNVMKGFTERYFRNRNVWRYNLKLICGRCGKFNILICLPWGFVALLLRQTFYDTWSFKLKRKFLQVFFYNFASLFMLKKVFSTQVLVYKETQFDPLGRSQAPQRLVSTVTIVVNAFILFHPNLLFSLSDTVETGIISSKIAS